MLKQERLSAQAAQLTMDYQQKKVQEEFLHKQYQVQKEHHDKQTELQMQMQKMRMMLCLLSFVQLF